MKLDVKVKNLGKIKEAEFHIRPMTVITGPNGTGKSFFTKSLYSILNVINRNVYHEWVVLSIKNLYLLVSSIGYIAPEYSSLADKILFRLNELENEFQEISAWKINEYLNFCSSKVSDVEKIRLLVGDYADYLILKLNNMSINTADSNNKPHSMDVNFVKRFQETNNNFFEVFLNHLKKSQIYYAEIFSAHIQNEFKENFQVSDLSDLIGFGAEQLRIEVDDFLRMELNKGQQLSIILNNDIIDEIIQSSSVVFFESPAYWKVRSALKSAKDNQWNPRLLGKKNDDILIGVPKYFYDLDDVLNTRTKTPGAFKSVADILENTLGGKFIFKGDDFSFADESGREISKNLVSFGMTNLGMIQALLKHNIITKGSFIFIDEPEANLHPDWQVKLVEVLLILAKSGVNVVITTHSSDLMKALEVKIKKQQIDIMEDFLSVHFVDVDGKLLEFESEEPIQQLIEARSLLNAAYEELYFSDL